MEQYFHVVLSCFNIMSRLQFELGDTMQGGALTSHSNPLIK